MPDYPPLSPSEIADVERRARAGETLAKAELDRLEQHSPIIDREIMMVCHRGQLIVKRYLGIDLAER
jgi:trimethylamine:corrinoid methyltransferase-like protein